MHLPVELVELEEVQLMPEAKRSRVSVKSKVTWNYSPSQESRLVSKSKLWPRMKIRVHDVSEYHRIEFWHIPIWCICEKARENFANSSWFANFTNCFPHQIFSVYSSYSKDIKASYQAMIGRVDRLLLLQNKRVYIYIYIYIYVYCILVYLGG